MSGERNIPNENVTDQAGIEVLVNGEVLPLSVPVATVEIRRAFNSVANARISVVDGDPSTEDAQWSSSDYFIPGNEIEIKAGYEQNYESLFKGIVTGQKLKVRKNATPNLLVECHDKCYTLTLGRKNRYFTDMSDSDIMSEILDESSIDKELESTSLTNKQMVQYRSSDWDFMLMRAEVNGKAVLTDENTFKLLTPDVTASPSFHVLFGSSLLEFDGSLDARSVSESTEAKGWSFTDQDLSTVENGSIDENAAGSEDSASLASSAGFAKNELRNSAVNDTTELEEVSNAYQFRLANTRLRGRAKFTGTKEAVPGITVSMEGLGERLNGVGFVWGIRHELTSGSWSTDVELGIPKEAFHERFDVAEPQAGGLLPPVNGLEIGIVTAIGEDPDGEFRIKVKVPTIDNEDEGNWARICTLDAGNERGSFFRPEIDDEVVLGFINDDPRVPIVLGMLNSSALPAPSENTDDNHEKGFVTRSGMKLWFNDDLVSTTIETPNGNKIVLSEDEGSIHIEDENGNTTTLNSDGITMDSAGDISITASGNITLDGTDITLTATGQLSASGSSGAELSSDGTTDVKGSLVQLN